MEKAPIISIIMSAYNAERYINDAIQSVLNQDHEKWELIIVNDGSTDNTKSIINSYTDSRIKTISKKHEGVSKSRNLALNIMKGDWFCFLDADDIFTKSSLSSRLKITLVEKDISFVDGSVLIENYKTRKKVKEYIPKFKGFPLYELCKLSEECFVGNTWLIKRDSKINYRFIEEMTHSEDICFYLSIAENKIYSYTRNRILIYRKRNDSAMTNYQSLEEGYYKLYKYINNTFKITNSIKFFLRIKIAKIMFLTYIFNEKSVKNALKSLQRNFLMTSTNILILSLITN